MCSRSVWRTLLFNDAYWLIIVHKCKTNADSYFGTVSKPYLQCKYKKAHWYRKNQISRSVAWLRLSAQSFMIHVLWYKNPDIYTNYAVKIMLFPLNFTIVRQKSLTKEKIPELLSIKKLYIIFIFQVCFSN